MGFGSTRSEHEAQSQEDIVRSKVKMGLRSVTDQIVLPGMDTVLQMDYKQLVTLFTTALRVRTPLEAMSFKLGEYDCKPMSANVAGVSEILGAPYKRVAEIIVDALLNTKNAVGIELEIFTAKDGHTTAALKVLVANKDPVGPSIDDSGDEVPGDPEWGPTLFVTYATTRVE